MNLALIPYKFLRVQDVCVKNKPLRAEQSLEMVKKESDETSMNLDQKQRDFERLRDQRLRKGEIKGF